MTKKDINCPLEKTLEIISGRWRVLIIRELAFKGTLRFGELQRQLIGISQRILTQELRALQKFKIITRKSYNVMPPKVEYSLTATGKTLEPVLKAMSEWGQKYKK